MCATGKSFCDLNGPTCTRSSSSNRPKEGHTAHGNAYWLFAGNVLDSIKKKVRLNDLEFDQFLNSAEALSKSVRASNLEGDRLGFPFLPPINLTPERKQSTD